VFASVTTVNTSDWPIEDAAIVGEEMETWLQDVEGFKGILFLSKEGTTIGVTFWETEEAAERALTLRMEFLERITSVADVTVQGVEAFEVAFARLGPSLVGPSSRPRSG
jgi:hypothetical protein